MLVYTVANVMSNRKQRSPPLYIHTDQLFVERKPCPEACDDPLLNVLWRLYWKRLCNFESLSSWASGRSDILDRGGDRGEVSARLLADIGEVGTACPFVSRP